MMMTHGISSIEINMKTNINRGKMVRTPNFLLEYTIDSLLKTFNPQRKPVMPQSNFFKLMNLLDTRLRNQGVDIELPGYWYRYGFYIDIDFLDIVLPRKFSEIYMIDDTHVVPPMHPRREYEIEEQIRRKIDSTIHWLWEQYKYKSNYGAKAKKESYSVSAPYEFNTTFQEYIKIANRREAGFVSRKEGLEPILDKLLSEFPEKEFSELYDTYLGWDDSTRLTLDCVPEDKQDALLKKLMNLFWETYSKGVRIRHNQNIPKPDIISLWKDDYVKSISDTQKQIEDIRKKVLSEHYKASGKDEGLIKQLMKKAYEMSAEAR
jgi:hypothetical protein